MKKSPIEIIIAIVFGIGLSVAIYYLMMFQFEIYKKKHGDDMTFGEFLLDAERK